MSYGKDHGLPVFSNAAGELIADLSEATLKSTDPGWIPPDAAPLPSHRYTRLLELAREGIQFLFCRPLSTRTRQ